MSSTKWTLNEVQRQRVEATYQQGLKDGNFHEMYQELADIMDDTTLPNGKKLVGSSPQYENARKWLEVATCANGGFGPHSDFIRHYTDIQGEIRLGRSFTETEMQTASNAVALNLYNDLHKSGWQFPTIDRIANLDAVAVGQTLYKNANAQECAISTNCAWTGAVAFSPLQSDQTYRLLSKGNPQKADTLDDHLNVIYASYSFDESAKAVRGGVLMLTTPASFDSEGFFCGVRTQLQIKNNPFSPDNYYADNVLKNSLAAETFAQVYKLDTDVALDMLRSAYGGKIVKDTNNNIAHDDFTQNAHAFHSSLTLAQRNNTPVQLLQGTPEQWLQMAHQDNYTGKVYRNALLNQSAYLVALPEQVLDQRPGVAHPPRNAREQNALVNGTIEVAKALEVPANQISPLLKHKAALDTPAQTQTAEVQTRPIAPGVLQTYERIHKDLDPKLAALGYNEEQRANIAAGLTNGIVSQMVAGRTPHIEKVDVNSYNDKVGLIANVGIRSMVAIADVADKPAQQSLEAATAQQQTLAQEHSMKQQQSMSQGGPVHSMGGHRMV